MANTKKVKLKNGKFVPVHCAFDEMVPIEKLQPNPNNPNTHPAAQIKALKKIIKYTGWRAPITISNRSGEMVKGHGRLAAAKAMGCLKVPVDYQDYKTAEDEIADMLADNKIAELSNWNENLLDLNIELLDVSEFDLELAGFGIELGGDEDDEPVEEENIYTSKVSAPTYEPSGEKPQLSELFNPSKVQELIEEIDEMDIAEGEKFFLRAAAYRHCVFNYSKIADYYAHSNEMVQGLMEDSALVIIDFNKAIEDGYVKLTKALQIQYTEDSTTEDEDGTE